MKKNLVKIRLRKTHYHNGVRKSAGNVIAIDKAAAQLLIQHRVAKAI